MEIRRYESDLLCSNMYLIVENRHAIVIDPFRDTSPAKDLIIDQILLTHEHYDHISGVNAWKESFGANLICSKPCAENIKNPKKNLAYHFSDFCELQTWIILDKSPLSDPLYSCCADETFEDKMALLWQGHKFEMIETPGHSMGSIGIMLDDRDFFSGDSIIKNCEIELRLPGGSKKKWEEIGRKRIEAIPDGTKIWPGHFDSFIWHKPEQKPTEDICHSLKVKGSRFQE